MKAFAVVFSAAILGSSALSAHPTGHEAGLVETIQHVASHPYHLLVVATTLFVGAWGARAALRARRKDRR